MRLNRAIQAEDIIIIYIQQKMEQIYLYQIGEMNFYQIMPYVKKIVNSYHMIILMQKQFVLVVFQQVCLLY